MRFFKFIIILPLLWWGGQVRAQVPDEPSSMPEQWQLTLDVIKSKAQTLVVKNNGLQAECQQLTGQVQELQQSINNQQYKNDQAEQFLKERNGRTDQQLRIEESTDTVKAKGQKLREVDDQLRNWEKKKLDLDNKIQQLKGTILNIEHQQQAQERKASIAQNTQQAQADDLSQWRKQLEDENKQEALLEKELIDLKTSNKAQNLNGQQIEEQNKELEAHLAILQEQKLQHLKKYSDIQQAQAQATRYEQLEKRKNQLEENISVYESRMDALRESSLMELSWTLKRKKLVHEMVQMDARNNKLREKIKGLREDIDVLKDQVSKLERRLDFVKRQDTMQ